MKYCVELNLDDGLVFASDSRTNATNGFTRYVVPSNDERTSGARLPPTLPPETTGIG